MSDPHSDITTSVKHDHWFAVRVKPNFEKASATNLTVKGLHPFLPTFKEKRQWSDRIKLTEVPLFPGYVFCRFNRARRASVLSTPGVIGIVSAGGQLLPVDEGELHAIRQVNQTGIPAEPWPFITTGRRVSVTTGALKGVEGIVIETKNKSRLVLLISLLQRSISIEVDRDNIRPVH